MKELLNWLGLLIWSAFASGAKAGGTKGSFIPIKGNFWGAVGGAGVAGLGWIVLDWEFGRSQRSIRQRLRYL